MNKHPIDSLIDSKINLLQELKDYLDVLITNPNKYFDVEQDKNGVYWVGIDFKVDLDVIKISSIGFGFTIAEIYQFAFLMYPAPISEIIGKFFSERMHEEIKFMLYGPEEGEEVEEIYDIVEWIEKHRNK